MKKLLIAVTLLLGSSIAQAEQLLSVNKSSAIASTSTGYLASAYLDVVVVGAASTGGVLELYNSTFTTSVLISSVSLGTARDFHFNNLAVKGLYWRTSTNTNGVTIIYKSR